MTKDDLYSRIIKLVPVERDDFKMGFQEVLNKSFDSYKGLLREYVNSASDDFTEKDIEEVNSICTQINDIIKYQYRGLHSKAFNEFTELMDGKGHVRKYLISYFGNNTPYLYRMRTFELKRNISRKDMFHIPLSKRGMASTQRYSVPGYPCLYMGESIYACWEELKRPPLNSCMVSRLSVNTTCLLDLRVPNEKEFDSRFVDTLLRFPLIIACMVPVLEENEKDNFKPEYSIPQLLTEFIIEGFPEEITDINKLLTDLNDGHGLGIRYTSVHKNKDFNFQDDKFDNVVVPVITPLSKTDYCPILTQLFKITEPTCDDYERIKGNYGPVWEEIESDPEELINYKKSVFGIMEHGLNNGATSFI